MKKLSVKELARKYTALYWTIGFVRNGWDGVMNDNPIQVEWLKMPQNMWIADPFVLDVSDDEIQVLVEEMPVEGAHKGVITLLKVDRRSMALKYRKVILELSTHLSFPCILRDKDKIYIYPENALNERLDVYEYDPVTETTSFVRTICDDVVWDSCITDLFGEKMLFTAAHNDLILDIYRWDGGKERFLPWKQVVSDNKNSRMGGQLFEYKGEVYYPAQDCNRNYGSAIQIKKIRYKDGNFTTETVKKITSPHPTMKRGIHTLNEYKGIVVTDVLGYRYPLGGRIADWIVSVGKRFLSRC